MLCAGVVRSDGLLMCAADELGGKELCYCFQSKASVRDCPICWEPMSGGRSIFTTECGHRFHFSCLQVNYQNGNIVCPLCRAGFQEPPVVLQGMLT